jgi:hypothetical protein
VSDRLTLVHAIEDAGIERTKADIAAVRADVQSAKAELKADIAAVRANADLIEHRLLTRLGGLMIVVGGVLFAALHYWPPSGHG